MDGLQTTRGVVGGHARSGGLHACRFVRTVPCRFASVRFVFVIRCAVSFRFLIFVSLRAVPRRFGSVRFCDTMCRFVSVLDFRFIACPVVRYVLCRFASLRTVSFRRVTCRFVPFRFVPFCVISYRSVSFRFVPLRAVLCHFMPFRFVPFRVTSCRFVLFRFVSFRFVLCSHRVFFVRFGRDSVVDASDVDGVRPAPRRCPVSYRMNYCGGP